MFIVREHVICPVPSHIRPWRQPGGDSLSWRPQRSCLSDPNNWVILGLILYNNDCFTPTMQYTEKPNVSNTSCRLKPVQLSSVFDGVQRPLSLCLPRSTLLHGLGYVHRGVAAAMCNYHTAVVLLAQWRSFILFATSKTRTGC